MDWPLSPFLSAPVSRIHVALKTVHWQPLLWVDEAIFSVINLDFIPPRMSAFTSYFFVIESSLFFLLCFVRVVTFPFNILCFWWIWKVDDSLFKRTIYFCSMRLGVLPALRSVHHVYAWCTWRPEEGVRHFRLELEMVVRQDDSAENWTLSLWKSSKCF